MRKRKGLNAASPSKTIKKGTLGAGHNHSYGNSTLLNMTQGNANHTSKVKIFTEK